MKFRNLVLAIVFAVAHIGDESFQHVACETGRLPWTYRGAYYEIIDQYVPRIEEFKQNIQLRHNEVKEQIRQLKTNLDIYIQQVAQAAREEVLIALKNINFELALPANRYKITQDCINYQKVRLLALSIRPVITCSKLSVIRDLEIRIESILHQQKVANSLIAVCSNLNPLLLPSNSLEDCLVQNLKISSRQVDERIREIQTDIAKATKTFLSCLSKDNLRKRLAEISARVTQCKSVQSQYAFQYQGVDRNFYAPGQKSNFGYSQSGLKYFPLKSVSDKTDQLAISTLPFQPSKRTETGKGNAYNIFLEDTRNRYGSYVDNQQTNDRRLDVLDTDDVYRQHYVTGLNKNFGYSQLGPKYSPSNRDGYETDQVVISTLPSHSYERTESGNIRSQGNTYNANSFLEDKNRAKSYVDNLQVSDRRLDVVDREYEDTDGIYRQLYATDSNRNFGYSQLGPKYSPSNIDGYETDQVDFFFFFSHSYESRLGVLPTEYNNLNNNKYNNKDANINDKSSIIPSTEKVSYTSSTNNDYLKTKTVKNEVKNYIGNSDGNNDIVVNSRDISINQPGVEVNEDKSVNVNNDKALNGDEKETEKTKTGESGNNVLTIVGPVTVNEGSKNKDGDDNKVVNVNVNVQNLSSSNGEVTATNVNNNGAATDENDYEIEEDYSTEVDTAKTDIKGNQRPSNSHTNEQYSNENMKWKQDERKRSELVSTNRKEAIRP